MLFGFKEAALAITAMALGMAAFVAALKDANAKKLERLSEAQVQSAAEILKLYASVTELVQVQRARTLAEMEKYGDGPLPSDWPDVQIRIGKTVDAIEKVNALFDQQIWPGLAARVPAMEALKVQRAWCCHYDVTPDHNAILGCHPDLPSFVTACGFSGHGLQQSPGIGRAISELLIHRRFTTLDLSRFGAARYAEGKPILESNVY